MGYCKSMKEKYQGLGWYLTRENHGRGKLTGETREFLNAGLLHRKWLSRTDWVLTISAKGIATCGSLGITGDEPITA
jgi:hypothetical protein